MNNTVSVSIKSAGRMPWRNPIIEIAAVHYDEAGDQSRTLQIDVLPRNGSEVLWNADAPIVQDGAKDEAEALSELSSFCWAAGRDTSIIFADLNIDYAFIDAAFNRRSSVISLPERLICLRTFALLLLAHGKFKARSLLEVDLYKQITGDELRSPTTLQRAVAVGEVYQHLVDCAGWKE